MFPTYEQTINRLQLYSNSEQHAKRTRDGYVDEVNLECERDRHLFFKYAGISGLS